MSLKDYKFDVAYTKILDDDLYNSLFKPAMENSTLYLRATGYFSSTVYAIFWPALKTFITNGGKIKLYCSPELCGSDKDAISKGYEGRTEEELSALLKAELDSMINANSVRDYAKLVACLISQGIMDVKIIIKKPNMKLDTIFHDKYGLFIDDDGNALSFGGSMNETYYGISREGDSDTVFVFDSWEGERDAQRCNFCKSLFDLFDTGGELCNYYVTSLPKDIIEMMNEVGGTINLEEELSRICMVKKKSGIPPLRPHQSSVLDDWRKNNHRGIVKHATGSGKTITGICAVEEALNHDKIPLVIVPSKILFHHWQSEISKYLEMFNITFVMCGDNNDKKNWSNQIFRFTFSKTNQNVVIIAIINSAATLDFINCIKNQNRLFMLVDEVHSAGSVNNRAIFQIDAGWRLGLSATPERYGDPDGTQRIFEYFGKILSPEYSLQDAIRDGVLSKYYYYPYRVFLDEDESIRWEKITRQMIVISNSNLTDEEKIQKLKEKATQRSRIAKKATDKIKVAEKIIVKNYQKGDKWIVFCEDIDQLHKLKNRLVLDNLSGIMEYHSRLSNDASDTIETLEFNGGLLLSIRCLDEGVDIPSVTTALIMASSKNPRQFIQRRGRVLRLADNKIFATIYDLIIVPTNKDEVMFESLIKSELVRSIEFGKWAENWNVCTTEIKNIAVDYGLNLENLIDDGDEENDDEQ